MVHMRPLQVRDNRQDWFTLGASETRALATLDILLMRKDPPFDMDYIYSTYILDLAEQAGVVVLNRPQALRDANEKLFITRFPQCCVPALVTRRSSEIKAFVGEHGLSVVKPLDGMGGSMVFRISTGEPNTGVILETLTDQGQRTIMAQRFIPEIQKGDKRILMVNGDPVPYSLARIPQPGETRGNLAAGAKGQGIPLSERDLWIAEQVGPALKERGIL